MILASARKRALTAVNPTDPRSLPLPLPFPFPLPFSLLKTVEALWRSIVLSTEAIQAVQSLKLAKSRSNLHQVLNTRLTRLLKADLLDTLTELQRQNQLDLALKVYHSSLSLFFLISLIFMVFPLLEFRQFILNYGKSLLLKAVFRIDGKCCLLRNELRPVFCEIGCL